MRFGTVPLGEAEGAILVHGVRAGGRLFKKGRVVTRADLAQLREAQIATVTVARLDPTDVPEDIAATRVAQALKGDNIRLGAAFTGRVNLYATNAGLVLLDRARLEALNLIHETVTIATLPPFAMVAPGEMVATVKIIPYAAPADAVTEAEAMAAKSTIAVAPFKPMTAALISTELPGQKAALLDKNRSALEARLQPLSGTLIFEKRCSHTAAAVAEGLKAGAATGADIFFIFGASAITDRRDVIPAGIVEAGGKILHFGMPVDPGNLLLLGELKGKPAIGLPSCARSPKVNGFDFVLRRIFAGLSVEGSDLMRMGVGGLLQEIPTRPQPRDAEHAPLRAPRIAAVILAAGLSSRMGTNKLLAEWRGKPLLRWSVEAALKSDAKPVIVVIGHEAGSIESALKGLDVRFARSADYAKGLSASLKSGIEAVLESSDGAIIMLGDMPEVSAGLIDRMIAGFSPPDAREICIAVHEHERGNPVLFARNFFPEILALSGDVGAKSIIAAHEDVVCEFEAGKAALRDVDTPDALAKLRAESEVLS